ncbi:hypothetical protein Hanom_Chr04g00303781 [Helianthus anomalus]
MPCVFGIYEDHGQPFSRPPTFLDERQVLRFPMGFPCPRDEIVTLHTHSFVHLLFLIQL